MQKNTDVQLIARDAYKEYRLLEYDPSVPIVPWKTRLPGKITAETNWLKAIKPKRNGYKLHVNLIPSLKKKSNNNHQCRMCMCY